MSAGLEIRGKSMRIWWRIDDIVEKETLSWPNTPENIEKAHKLANLIKLEIELGHFNLAKHFPNSKLLAKNQISYYAKIWNDMIIKEVSPCTYDGYKCQLHIHVLPRWGKTHPKDIENNEIKKWIFELKQTLNPKTIREVVTRLASIHSIWRNEQRIAYNPFETITIQQLDTPEPDPFTKAEINTILATEADLDIENLLPCIFWTGLSISEQIPIAWEDVDLVKGTIHIQRSYVKGIFRVTKNRRRSREIKLLQPALEALKKQYQLTGNRKGHTVRILQRDNQTYKTQRIRFVWLNFEQATNFEYHELRYRWNKHLRRSKVRMRGINQGRHTFASQLLTSGRVPPEWIADQLGHSDTSMIYKHYGKLIAEDAPDYLSQINNYIST